MKSLSNHTFGAIYLPGLLLVLLTVITLLFTNHKINSLHSQHYQKTSAEMNANVARLIEAKRKSTLALTLALADNDNIKQVLQNSSVQQGMNEASKRLSAELRKNTKYKNVWFQLIDKQGISRSRSWVDKYGDKISLVRPDVQEMLKNPQAMETISTGKFTISFKSMVPIYHQNEFIGMVEVITHFNSIIKELEQSGIESLVLVDKRYQKQLTKAVSRTFIDGYYLANFDVNTDNIQHLQRAGLLDILNSSAYHTDDTHLFTIHTISGVNDSKMGFYIQIIPLDAIKNTEKDTFIRNILIIAALVILIIFSMAALAFHNKKQAEREKEFFQAIIDSSSDLILIASEIGIISANEAFHHFFPRLDDQTLQSLNPYIQDTEFLNELQRAGGWFPFLKTQTKTSNERDLHFEVDQKTYYLSLNIQPLLHDKGSFVLRLIDITERKKTEDKLRFSANVFTHVREGIMITKENGEIIDVNDAFLNITGFSREEVLGNTPNLLNSGHHGKEFFALLWQDISDKGYWSGEIWNKRKNGELFAEMLTISTVEDSHSYSRYYVALFSDITAQKKHQQQLEHIAHYDALTGLPNRRHLSDLLHQAMAEAETQQKQLAVFYLDLDGFKAVNDNHSHEFGDKLLMTLSTRMQESLDPNDFIGRIGGDEFVGVLVDIPSRLSCETIFAHLLRVLKKPVLINGYQLEVSASIGISFYPQSAVIDADTLLRQADQAMYQAKLSGKNRFHIFDAQKDQSLRGHHEAIEQIRLGIQQGEFRLFYQPKVNMKTGRLIGVEALIRWQHPEHGLLLPAHFIPTVSNHPLSIDLGEWVIRSAIKQTLSWMEAGHTIPVSVNISPLQLQDPHFTEHLQNILSEFPNLPDGHLQFEVIETQALENLTEVIHILKACAEMGVSVSLDDFGTGYSSLSYLKQLPAEELKIDRSFIRDMLDDPEDLAILEATLGLARSFHRTVVAEGVESEAHGVQLLQLGCEVAQGFFISKPVPAEQIPQWLNDWTPPQSWLTQTPLPQYIYPLLYTCAEHRAWMARYTDYLQGELQQYPELTSAQSFRHWRDSTEADDRHSQNIATMIEELFEQINQLIADKDLRNRDINEVASQLDRLNNALLTAMRQLIQPIHPH